MDIQTKLKGLKDLKSYSIPAKRIMDHLKPILSKSHDLSRRWIWELLQNASDLGDNVKTVVEIDETNLTFKHDAKPFSLDEAYNLIMPDSTKDDESTKDKSVIGQFGTGFISTHVLSKVITVSGLIEDEGEFHQFTFNLDRSERTDKEFLIKSIKESEIQYREKLSISASNSNALTCFKYHLKDTYTGLDSTLIVNEGLKTFQELIPFVFAFRPQLSEISIVDARSQRTVYKYVRKEHNCGIEQLSFTETIVLKNDKPFSKNLVGTITKGETTIAFLAEKLTGDQYSFLPFPEDCPKLYCAFPMIGTADFNFPVIINSEKFVPNKERDGIEITEFDELNRDRLKEAKDAYKILLTTAEKLSWTKCFNVVGLSSPSLPEGEVKKWFVKEVFNPLKTSIFDAKIVDTQSPSRQALNSSYIPYADKRLKDKEMIVSQIYELASKIMSDSVPANSDYKYWFEKLDFEVFDSEKLDLAKLCETSAAKGTVSEFMSEHDLTEKDAIDFFASLVRFVVDQEQPELLDKYALLINQSKKLRKIKGIKLDRINHKRLNPGYEESIKNIFKSLSKTDCRDDLLIKAFESIEALIEDDQSYTLKQICKDIDEELRSYEGNFQDEKFLLILKELFYWCNTCGLSDETIGDFMPFFATNKSQLYLNTKSPQELQHAFDIEISGKSEVLAKLANTTLSHEDLEAIAKNPDTVASFIKWINHRQEDNPDEDLGEIGETFIYHKLISIFGEDRVLWEKKQEFDFRILESDLKTTRYFIDAKTTARGIANSNNVPFYMRMSQWLFLTKQHSIDKYLIARVFMDGSNFDVRFVNIKMQSLN